MSITEGFLIMVRMVDGLLSMPILITPDGRNKSEVIPGHRIIFMITEIRIFTAAVDQAITIMICNLILVIKAFIQVEDRALQRFPGLMVIFVKLDIVIGFPVFLVSVNLEVQGAFLFFCAWNSANGRIERCLSCFWKS